MNLVFMGTPSFAVPSLQRLFDDGHSIDAVVTAPKRKRGRGQMLTDTPVGELAGALHLPVLRPDDLSDAGFHDALAGYRPDIIVVVAFRILPESIFSIPSKGIFNLHASLLPRYRGAAPIQWAILNGDEETGITTFLLKRKVDTGGILLQERVSIGAHETGGELHDRLSVIGADVVSRTVSMLAAGPPNVREQDETQVSHARKIRKDDMRIDWTQPVRTVRNTIRAFSPEPGAWTTLQDSTFKIFRSAVVSADATGDVRPGTVIDVTPHSCVVRCGDGTLALHEVMLEGRKRMHIEEFLRGFSVTEGTVLGAAGSLPGA